MRFVRATRGLCVRIGRAQTRPSTRKGQKTERRRLKNNKYISSYFFRGSGKSLKSVTYFPEGDVRGFEKIKMIFQVEICRHFFDLANIAF